MEQRAPVDEVGVLHLLEGVLDFGLTAVGRDNLLIGPIQVVGEESPMPTRPTPLGMKSGRGRPAHFLALARVEDRLVPETRRAYHI